MFPAKLKSKDKKPGSLRAAFRNQERKERTANGGFRQPKSTTAAVLSPTEVDELKNGEALFDEEVWKKRTDDLVHAICRVIRYPSSEGKQHFESHNTEFLLSGAANQTYCSRNIQPVLIFSEFFL